VIKKQTFTSYTTTIYHQMTKGA